MKVGLLDNTLVVNGSSVPRHIDGISCDVQSCVYHDGDNYCTADKIAVGPSFATSCTDTVCASFKLKDQNL